MTITFFDIFCGIYFIVRHIRPTGKNCLTSNKTDKITNSYDQKCIPQGPNPSLKAQIPVLRTKFLKARISASRLGIGLQGWDLGHVTGIWVEARI